MIAEVRGANPNCVWVFQSMWISVSQCSGL